MTIDLSGKRKGHGKQEHISETGTKELDTVRVK